jgi:hypothetical protein
MEPFLGQRPPLSPPAPAADQIDTALQKAEKTKDLFYEVEIEPVRWEDLKPVRPA